MVRVLNWDLGQLRVDEEVRGEDDRSTREELYLRSFVTRSTRQAPKTPILAVQGSQH